MSARMWTVHNRKYYSEFIFISKWVVLFSRSEMYRENVRYIPLRLTPEERKHLIVLEGALRVSEYTDRVDIRTWRKDAIIRQEIEEMLQVHPRNKYLESLMKWIPFFHHHLLRLILNLRVWFWIEICFFVRQYRIILVILFYSFYRSNNTPVVYMNFCVCSPGKKSGVGNHSSSLYILCLFWMTLHINHLSRSNYYIYHLKLLLIITSSNIKRCTLNRPFWFQWLKRKSLAVNYSKYCVYYLCMQRFFSWFYCKRDLSFFLIPIIFFHFFSFFFFICLIMIPYLFLCFSLVVYALSLYLIFLLHNSYLLSNFKVIIGLVGCTNFHLTKTLTTGSFQDHEEIFRNIFEVMHSFSFALSSCQKIFFQWLKKTKIPQWNHWSRSKISFRFTRNFVCLNLSVLYFPKWFLI